MIGHKFGQRTPLPHWGQTHLAALLGVSNVMLGRYLNGLSYPTLKMMQKLEVVFGWPVVDQVPLIPYYWEWPDQHQSGRGVKQAEPTDLRWSMKLTQVVQEWTEANPRTQLLQEIRMHPSLEDKRQVRK